MSGPTRQPRRVWTVEEIRALGVTCDIRTAAHVLGIGRTTAFELLRAKKFPVRTLQMGRVRRVPVQELLAYVGALTEKVPGDRRPASAPTDPCSPEEQ
jgi:hypothetical protein